MYNIKGYNGLDELIDSTNAHDIDEADFEVWAMASNKEVAYILVNGDIEYRRSVDFKELDLSTVLVEGINPKDSPDFVDAFIVEALYKSGEVLTEFELDELNNDGDFIHSQVMRTLY